MDSYLTFLYSCCLLGLALNIPIVTTENYDLVDKQNQMDNLTAMNIIVSDVMIQFDIRENWSSLCNISQTGLTDFNIVCFIKDIADKLKILNFSGNGIYDSLHILQGWQLRFPMMEYLDFSDNSVKSLPLIRDYRRTMKGIKSLGIIDVKRNKINSLTKGMIDSFSTHKFVKVDISENPFLCDCDIIEVMEYLSSKTMPKAYDYLGSLECANPSNVRGRQLLSLSLTDLNCTRNNETGINVSILETTSFNDCNTEILNSYITTEEVVIAAKFLKNNKASGSDCITNEMLQISCNMNIDVYENLVKKADISDTDC
ncbi:unnamed protein product [Mytilus coruscus]|uniref:LRRCT domain-containing protein n=1 Tax=Mytilus coruscus TaxID=42192 RepID=A0A6J8CSG8_MYTCO|nr:unnamed protein product [Mytilus coruscus]